MPAVCEREVLSVSNAEPGKPYIYHVAEAGFRHGASYLYITMESRPFVRVGLQDLVPFGDSAINKGQVQEFIDRKAPAFHKKKFDSTGFARFAFPMGQGARCRVDLVSTVKGPSIALHMLPGELPGLDSLNLSRAVLDYACANSGIFLVCGKPRSGKTTTLASMLQQVNESSCKHVVWISEVAEYLLAPCKSFVNQIETAYLDDVCEMTAILAPMGADVIAFDLQAEEGLLWQAVLAAENGASVFLTTQCAGTTYGLEKLVNTVGSGLRREFASRLSQVFTGAVYQELVQGAGSPVPATEFLVGTQPVKNLLREGKFLQIQDLIAAGEKYGMETLEKSKRRLSGGGLI